MSYWEKKKRDKLVDVVFRNKEIYGWKGARATYRFAKHPEKIVDVLGSYYRSVLMRPSCSACPFTNTQRPGDITIGDFWSEKQIPQLNQDNKGCSLIIANTHKGKALVDGLNSVMNVVPISREDALQYNLQHPTPEDANRSAFEEEYVRKGFLSAMRKYHDLSWKKQLRLYFGNIKRTIKK